jgi:hypothetical protein
MLGIPFTKHIWRGCMCALHSELDLQTLLFLHDQTVCHRPLDDSLYLSMAELLCL